MLAGQIDQGHICATGQLQNANIAKLVSNRHSVPIQQFLSDNGMGRWIAGNQHQAIGGRLIANNVQGMYHASKIGTKRNKQHNKLQVLENQ
jgi:hypothetical protein